MTGDNLFFRTTIQAAIIGSDDALCTVPEGKGNTRDHVVLNNGLAIAEVRKDVIRPADVEIM